MVSLLPLVVGTLEYYTAVLYGDRVFAGQPLLALQMVLFFYKLVDSRRYTVAVSLYPLSVLAAGPLISSSLF